MEIIYIEKMSLSMFLAVRLAMTPSQGSPPVREGVWVCACMCLWGQLPEVMHVEFPMDWHDGITYGRRKEK